MRTIISVDLQDLAEPFQAFCEREGIQRRDRASVVRKALEGALGLATARPARNYKATGGGGSRKWLRASVSPETYDRLLLAMKASQARSLPEYLEAIAEQAVPVVVPNRKVIRKGLPPESMRAVSTSNGELMAIGKNVNQIAKSLHLHPGKTTEKDRELLRALPSVINKHTETVSKWLFELNPPRKRSAVGRK